MSTAGITFFMSYMIGTAPRPRDRREDPRGSSASVPTTWPRRSLFGGAAAWGVHPLAGAAGQTQAQTSTPSTR